jgi:hypothetical protein
VTALSFLLGIVVIALGAFWLAQGLGYIQGTFMTRVALWTWVGAAAAAVGVALTVFSISRRLRTAKTRS